MRGAAPFVAVKRATFVAVKRATFVAHELEEMQ